MMESTTTAKYYPHYPEFQPELVENCRKRNDFMPLLFEWFKYVGVISDLVASLPNANSHRLALHLAILRGLLSRVSRLMLAAVKLSAKGKHGESVKIFSRLITETAVKAEWLISQNSEFAFKRYLAGGLRAEVKLKERIEYNIKKRNGQMLQIEKRMLSSIDRYMRLSGLSLIEIMKIPDVPDLASMYKDLDLSDDQYIAAYRMGSQYVHGTWSDLVSHYLMVDDSGEFTPRGNDVVPNQEIFASTCLSVLRSMSAYSTYFFTDERLQKIHLEYLRETHDRILEVFRWSSGSDFEIATATI